MKSNTRAKNLTVQDKKSIKELRRLRKSGRIGKSNLWIIKEV